MESHTLDAPPVGTLGTLTVFKELLGVTALPFPPPFNATVVTVEGGVWSEAVAPSAVAVAAALGMPTRPVGTL